LVVFPSVEELQRMVDVDSTLKNHGVTLTISEWKDASDADPSYQFDEVWVHIKGVPHAWRHYLGFWALGSVIGATLDVDMYTYRKMGVIRVLVGMMNRDPLPLTTDIVFGTKGYEITFVMEDEKFTPTDPVVLKDDPRWDDEGGGDNGDDQEDKNPGHAKKKQRKEWNVGGPHRAQNILIVSQQRAQGRCFSDLRHSEALEIFSRIKLVTKNDLAPRRGYCWGSASSPKVL
jgi:hypothetical protein